MLAPCGFLHRFAELLHGQPITFSVPAGAVVTILNFVCSDVCKLSVSVNGTQADVLTATTPDSTNAASPKDIVIPGPATLSVSVLQGKTVYLSYKLTSNG